MNQAIKSWETALDSIETAAYMQSQTLALPVWDKYVIIFLNLKKKHKQCNYIHNEKNDEHAELVFRLRNLLDSANKINLNSRGKLINSSQTLQIIQSKLAIKQQLYADALLKTNSYQANQEQDEDLNSIAKSESAYSYKTINSPLDGMQKKYLSDDDNESFVSADSDVDWLNEEMLQNIQNIDEKNVLYEMALSNVKLNVSNVTYRVSRTELLDCKSETDFAAKLHGKTANRTIKRCIFIVLLVDK